MSSDAKVKGHLNRKRRANPHSEVLATVIRQSTTTSSTSGRLQSSTLGSSIRRNRNQPKATAFNVFRLLVPKETIEVVVDDTSRKMQSDVEVQQLDVQKLSSDGDKADENRKDSDLEVALVESEGRSISKQKSEPEIIVLDERPQSAKLKVDVSDEIIYLHDSKVPSVAAGPSSGESSIPQLKKAIRVQKEDFIVANRITPRISHLFGKLTFFPKRSFPRSSTNQGPFCSHWTRLPNFPPPIHNLSASNQTKSMRRFVDLLTEGTSVLCKKLLRKWDIVQNGTLDGRPLRICSYNVLCQATAYKTCELYTHLTLPGRADKLTWGNRRKLLAREFSMIDADIFCLQEVQHDHYEQFFRPYFETAGYNGHYKKRTGEMVDGCAIFYKTDFELLYYQYIEYYLGNNSLLNRANIGQLVRLKDLRSGSDFCIANTHLLFNKQRGDVKLAQLAVLLANIDRECGPESGQECPYILCGDLNVEPYSPLYNFIMSGRLCFAHLRRGDISGQGSIGGPFVSANLLPSVLKIGRNCRFKNLKRREMFFPPENCWSHPLCFNSVYRYIGSVNEQGVSTYHSVEAANPDFIFYSVKSKEVGLPICANQDPLTNVSEERLRLVRRLSLPDINQLAATLGPWPNEVTPSDHIPLIADFVLQ